MREMVEMSQSSEEKPRKEIRFGSAAARELFEESGLSVEDLEEPSGVNGFLVKDVRKAMKG